jgi:hypothetical protein
MQRVNKSKKRCLTPPSPWKPDLDIVGHSCIPATQEAEAEECLLKAIICKVRKIWFLKQTEQKYWRNESSLECLPNTGRGCMGSIPSRAKETNKTQGNADVGYCFTPIRIARIKKSDVHECWRGCGDIGTHTHSCRARSWCRQGAYS